MQLIEAVAFNADFSRARQRWWWISMLGVDWEKVLEDEGSVSRAVKD
jgi:hypothetical protein